MKPNKKVFRFSKILLLTLFVVSLTACGVPKNNEKDGKNIKFGTESDPDPYGWPAGMTEGYIPVDGGKVIYRLYGKDKSGTPMIFLHGGPGSGSEYFFKQCKLGEDHPVVFYNQLGSPGSPVSDEYTTADQVKKLFTIEHFVNELDTVVNYFGFDEFILVGKSWGTMLAVEYAAAKHPDGLKGIVLAGPFLKVETWINDGERLIKSLPDGKAMWQTVVECESTGKYTDAYNEVNKIYSQNFDSRVAGANDNTPKKPDVKVVAGVSVYNYMWGPSEFSCTGTLQGHDSTPLLASLTMPILYVCGEFDSGTPEAAKYYNSMTPNGEICVLPGCGHNSPRERPEEFNAIVKAFATRVSN